MYAIRSYYAKDELINEVCDIIGHHHHPRSKDTINFKVVYDSDLLENTEESKKNKSMDNDELERFIEKSFLTAAGRETAREILLGA